MSRSRDRPIVLGGREASAPVATPSTPWRVLKPEPLANPLLGKWLCVLKDTRPCRIFQCRYLSNLVGANSHRSIFVVTVDPSGELFLPEGHSPACPTPWRITAPTREFVKVRQSCPRRAIRDWHFARPNIANGSSDERSVPPTGQTFHYECFQVLTALDRVPQVSD